jgi:putative sugar O-methyltransferase
MRNPTSFFPRDAVGVRVELARAIEQRLIRFRGKLRRTVGMSRIEEWCGTYGLMKEDNQRAPERYRAGKFWEAINSDFGNLIWGGALARLRNEYFNRRFAGPDPRSRSVYGALLWLYYKQISQLDTERLLSRIREPVEGGDSDQEEIEGHRVSLDFLQAVEEFYRVREAWRLFKGSSQPRVILELGAGYGRLAYVFRKALPDCTYVIIDLPEALTCSSYWLTKVLRDEVVPYAESRNQGEFTRARLLARPVWTLGTHQIEQIQSGTIDAFVNIFSFQEMPLRIIENYFAQAERIVNGVVYIKERDLECNSADNEDITINDYRPCSSWRTLFKRPILLYQHYFEAAFAVGERV